MKKLLAVLLSLLLAAAAVVPLAAADDYSDLEWYIDDYHIDVVAAPDRSYHVTETIRVWFNVESRGITRDIPTSGSAESYEILDLQAVGDPYTDQGTGSIRIGDPDVYLKGEKTYTITYTLKHWADPETDADYFYFNIIGTEWDTLIRHFDADIHLPQGAEIQKVTLTGGSYGAKEEVSAYTVTEDGLHVEGTRELAAYEGATINVALNEGAFYEAVPYVPEYSVDLSVRVTVDESGAAAVRRDYSVLKNKETGESGLFRISNLESIDEVTITRNGEKTIESGRYYLYVDLSDVAVGQTAGFSVAYTVEPDMRRSKPVSGSFSFELTDRSADYWYESINFDFESFFTPSGGFVRFGNSYDNEEGTYEAGVRDNGFHFETLKRTMSSYTRVAVKYEDVTFRYTPGLGDYLLPGIGALLAIISGLLCAFRKEKPLVPTVQFYPPDRLSPAEVAYIYKNAVSGIDITSLIFYWASHGHLSIELRSKTSYTLHRLEPLDDAHQPYEAELYASLFALGDGDSVRSSQLDDAAYVSVNKARSRVKRSFSGDRKLVKGSGLLSGFRINPASMVSLMIVFIFFFGLSGCLQAVFFGGGSMGMLAFWLAEAVVLWGISSGIARRRYQGKSMLWWLSLLLWAVFSAVGVFVALFTVQGYSLAPLLCWIVPPVFMLAAVMLPYAGARTDFGIDVLGRVLGFRQFLQLAKKEQLEMLLEQNPSYYYDILPYAQVLDVSDIWEKKFKNMLTEPPSWYYGPGVDYSRAGFGMNSFYTKLSHNTTSSPSSSGGGSSGGGGGFSGGGFSGGGSSGGGSGGGGGGRW